MRLKIRRSLKRDLEYHDAKREILSDDEFLKELNIIAAKKKLNAEEAMLLCHGYLREIAARYTENRLFWRILTSIVRKNIINSFKNIYYNKENVKKIKKLMQNSLVAITPNHRSVFDFIILPYVLVKETTFIPIILAADVFNTFPIGYIFRRMGAYFVRRNENNELYFLIFKHYVMLILKYELMHMFFIEGGRNKTGGYSNPKKGILKYILDGAKKCKKCKTKKDLIFIPVNISYDIVPESSVVIKESASGVRKHIFSSVVHYLIKKNLGNCYINFGKPVRMSGFLERFKSEKKIIDSLGNALIGNIKSLVVVSPISLVCYTLLNLDEIKFNQFYIKFKANLDKLKKGKKNIMRIDLSKISAYLKFADEKGIIKFDKYKGAINIRPKQKQLINYYSSNIAHLFV